MARKGKVKSYFEPWVATKSVTHGKNPFPGGIPPEYPEGVGERILESWQRADEGAAWVLWGTGMAVPSVCKNLDGTISVMDDRRIIAVNKAQGLGDEAPSQEGLAKRIAACINACAGIGDPETFVVNVRSLLLSFALGEGEDPRLDSRVISLLSRCLPPEEMERYHEIEDQS